MVVGRRSMVCLGHWSEDVVWLTIPRPSASLIVRDNKKKTRKYNV
jgi:hypothetical protein